MELVTMTTFRVLRFALALVGASGLGECAWGNAVPTHLSGSTAATRGTIAGGSPALALMQPLDFQNGQGIRIDHAGTMPTIAPPGGLAVMQPDMTGGTRSYRYTVAALDGACGVAAAIAEVTTTTSQRLDAGHLPGANITGTADSGAPPHEVVITLGAPLGGIRNHALVTVSGVLGTTEANGTWDATSVDATHIRLHHAAYQHLFVSGGNPRLAVQAHNHLTWDPPAASAPPLRYAVYGNSVNNGGSLTLLGVASPKLITTAQTHSNTTLDGVQSLAGIATGDPVSGPGIPAGTTVAAWDYNADMITLTRAATATASGGVPIAVGALQWDDYGAQFTSHFAAEPCIPTTPPASDLAGYLITIISSGAGTTQLTLADAATTAAASQPVTHDDRFSIQDCIDAVPATGGVCYLASSGSYNVAGGLNIPRKVTLKCGLERPGDPGGQVYGTNQSAIRLDPGNPITSTGRIDGCLLIRYGMTVPSYDSQAYAGTGIYIGTTYDPSVLHSMVIGFGICISSPGPIHTSRVELDDLALDCNEAIYLNGSQDTTDVRHIHGWPYGTIAAPLPLGAIANRRLGTGLEIEGGALGATIDDVLMYGFAPDYKIGAGGLLQVGRIYADDVLAPPASHVPCIQFVNWLAQIHVADIEATTCGIGIGANNGASTDRIDIAQAYIDNAPDDCVLIQNSGAGNTGTTHFGVLRTNRCWGTFGHGWGIDYDSKTAYLDIDLYGPEGVANSAQAKPVGLVAGATSDKFRIARVQTNDPDITGGIYGGYLGCPILPSAATMNLGIGGQVSCVEVTGTTSIKSFTGQDALRPVMLLFDRRLTVLSGDGNITLSNGVRFVTRTGSALTVEFVPLANAWVEIWRRY
jgi:hypothetical protein